MPSRLPKREETMDPKEKPIISMSKEEREEVWDDAYAKEEGIIIEFDPITNTGTIRSLADGTIYKIDDRELVRTKIELHSGDKVLFSPFEDPDGDDFARIIRIIELNA
jgi:hypothetical protein